MKTMNRLQYDADLTALNTFGLPARAAAHAHPAATASPYGEIKKQPGTLGQKTVPEIQSTFTHSPQFSSNSRIATIGLGHVTAVKSGVLKPCAAFLKSASKHNI